MVQNRCFGSAGGARVVMRGDAVQELGLLRGGQTLRVLLDQAQAEVHVTEEASFVPGGERRPAAELERAPDVVQKGGGDEGFGGPVMSCTCAYAIYDPVTRSCTMASAGHPPPAVLYPDGTVAVSAVPAGPPIGMGIRSYESLAVELPESSVIALYLTPSGRLPLLRIPVELDPGHRSLLGIAPQHGPVQQQHPAARHVLVADHVQPKVPRRILPERARLIHAAPLLHRQPAAARARYPGTVRSGLAV